MDQQPIDERLLVGQFRRDNLVDFYQFIERYESFIAPIMRARGYKRINKVKRTVLFTFGEVTFERSRWSNGKRVRIPVDEKLGLAKRISISKELMFQITRLATLVPYRKVVEIVELMYGIYISKDTVIRCLNHAEKLLKEREDYRFFEESEEVVKEKAPIIYLEGDGVMVKVADADIDNHRYDLSHFVIHTGSRKIRKNRFELQNKKEFVGIKNAPTREKVIDYLYNHFEITPQTLLITNSDNGHGYTPYVFDEIAKALGVKHHYHFWDSYHLNQKLRTFYKNFPDELLDGAFEAIKKHSKKDLKMILDTTESLLVTKEDEATFSKLRLKLLQNFKYTAHPNYYGLPHAGIGIMESQHRKLTYRMKKRGMYWSVHGLDRMSRLILLNTEGQIRDLFFGEWGEQYQLFTPLESADVYLQDNSNKDYGERLKGTITQTRDRKLIKKHLL